MEFRILLSTIVLLFSILYAVNAKTRVKNFDKNTMKAAAARPTKDEYLRKRAELIELERKRSLGYDLELTANEQTVNGIIMAAKMDEYKNSFNDPDTFNPSRHIFHILNQVNTSKLFNYLLKMPKGAILHAHDTALMASADFLVSFTYFYHLWECRDPITNRIQLFKFSRTKPESDCSVDGVNMNWKNVREQRQLNSTEYDADVRSHLTLLTNDPIHEYTNVNVVWNKFMKIFAVAESLITYKPVFEAYFERVLIQYYQDGVQYLEFRGTLPPVRFYSELFFS